MYFKTFLRILQKPYHISNSNDSIFFKSSQKSKCLNTVTILLIFRSFLNKKLFNNIKREFVSNHFVSEFPQMGENLFQQPGVNKICKIFEDKNMTTYCCNLFKTAVCCIIYTQCDMLKNCAMQFSIPHYVVQYTTLCC